MCASKVRICVCAKATIVYIHTYIYIYTHTNTLIYIFSLFLFGIHGAGEHVVMAYDAALKHADALSDLGKIREAGLRRADVVLFGAHFDFLLSKNYGNHYGGIWCTEYLIW
jgi:hypothetical protein